MNRNTFEQSSVKSKVSAVGYQAAWEYANDHYNYFSQVVEQCRKIRVGRWVVTGTIVTPDKIDTFRAYVKLDSSSTFTVSNYRCCRLITISRWKS